MICKVSSFLGLDINTTRAKLKSNNIFELQMIAGGYHFLTLVFLAKTTIHSLCFTTSTAFVPTSCFHIPVKTNTTILLRSFFNNNDDNKKDREIISSTHNQSKLDLIMPQIEKDVIASANAKIDVNRVMNALLSEKDKVKTKYDDDYNLEQTQPSHWSIALASGSIFALLSLVIFHQPAFSAFIFLIVSYLAAKDPVQENDGLVEGDDVSGHITRIVGRATIKSIEKSKPKVKAVARAAIFGDEEIDVLRQRLYELETENEKMKIWIRRRIAIDENAKFYSVDVLKEMARQNGISMEGNKGQLMMKLLEADVLRL